MNINLKHWQTYGFLIFLLFSKLVLAEVYLPDSKLTLTDQQLDELFSKFNLLEEDLTLYHWTQDRGESNNSNGFRWVAQGQMSPEELSFFNQSTGDRQVAGPGLYFSEQPMDSVHFGTVRVSVVAPEGMPIVDPAIIRKELGIVSHEDLAVIASTRPSVRTMGTLNENWWVANHPEILKNIKFVEGGIATDYFVGANNKVNHFKRLSGLMETFLQPNQYNAHHYIESLSHLTSYIDGITFASLVERGENPWTSFEPENFEVFRTVRRNIYLNSTEASQGPLAAPFTDADGFAKTQKSYLANIMRDLGGKTDYRERPAGEAIVKDQIVSESQLGNLMANEYLQVEIKQTLPDGSYVITYRYADISFYKKFKNKISPELYQAIEKQYDLAMASDDLRKQLNQRLVSELLDYAFTKHYPAFNTKDFNLRRALDFYRDLISIHPYTDFNGRSMRLYLEAICLAKDVRLPYFANSDFDLYASPVMLYESVLSWSKSRDDLIREITHEALLAKSEKREPDLKRLKVHRDFFYVQSPPDGSLPDLTSIDHNLIVKRKFVEFYNKVDPRFSDDPLGKLNFEIFSPNRTPAKKFDAFLDLTLRTDLHSENKEFFNNAAASIFQDDLEASKAFQHLRLIYLEAQRPNGSLDDLLKDLYFLAETLGAEPETVFKYLIQTPRAQKFLETQVKVSTSVYEEIASRNDVDKGAWLSLLESRYAQDSSLRPTDAFLDLMNQSFPETVERVRMQSQYYDILAKYDQMKGGIEDSVIWDEVKGLFKGLSNKHKELFADMVAGQKKFGSLTTPNFAVDLCQDLEKIAQKRCLEKFINVEFQHGSVPTIDYIRENFSSSDSLIDDLIKTHFTPSGTNSTESVDAFILRQLNSTHTNNFDKSLAILGTSPTFKTLFRIGCSPTVKGSNLEGLIFTLFLVDSCYQNKDKRKAMIMKGIRDFAKKSIDPYQVGKMFEKLSDIKPNMDELLFELLEEFVTEQKVKLVLTPSFIEKIAEKNPKLALLAKAESLYHSAIRSRHETSSKDQIESWNKMRDQYHSLPEELRKDLKARVVNSPVLDYLATAFASDLEAPEDFAILERVLTKTEINRDGKTLATLLELFIEKGEAKGDALFRKMLDPSQGTMILNLFWRSVAENVQTMEDLSNVKLKYLSSERKRLILASLYDFPISSPSTVAQTVLAVELIKLKPVTDQIKADLYSSLFNKLLLGDSGLNMALEAIYESVPETREYVIKFLDENHGRGRKIMPGQKILDDLKRVNPELEKKFSAQIEKSIDVILPKILRRNGATLSDFEPYLITDYGRSALQRALASEDMSDELLVYLALLTRNNYGPGFKEMSIHQIIERFSDRPDDLLAALNKTISDFTSRGLELNFVKHLFFNKDQSFNPQALDLFLAALNERSEHATMRDSLILLAQKNGYKPGVSSSKCLRNGLANVLNTL